MASETVYCVLVDQPIESLEFLYISRLWKLTYSFGFLQICLNPFI